MREGAETQVVETPFGTLVGAREDGVVRFRRVPYAAPPVNGLRFRLPEPLPVHDEPLDCTGEAVVPPQLPSRLAKVMGDYPMRQEEDCLHIDIWVPMGRGDKIPVLVFLHGGAFMTGGGSLPCYDGSALAANSGMIVINVSYRLGALGFLPIKGIGPANLGLHDQIMALAWIRKAAAAFGGDQGNITVAGQSAGAYSIALMTTMPDWRKLFDRAVLMSAPLGLALPTVDAQEQLERDYLAALGVSSSDGNELRQVPVGRLLEAQLKLLQRGRATPGDVTPPFVPAIDGDLIPADPREAFATGTAATCDLMIGTTREEMAAFYYGDDELAARGEEVVQAVFRRRFGEGANDALLRARAQRVPGTPLSLLGDLMTETVFAQPSRELAAARSDRGRPTFVYRFDWQSPTPGVQACHCIELPFLFGNLDRWAAAPMLAGADKGEVEDLSRLFQGAIAAFAKRGTPDGPGLPAWPAYGSSRSILHVDKSVEALAAAV
jgi:para-nitrobenzyl esterase